MRAADISRLIVLAALWGASFLCLRIVAPLLGPIVTAEARALIGAVALLVWLRIESLSLDWRTQGWALFIVGLTNSALPFMLLSFAAMTLPAAYCAILNATSPLFAAALAALWLGEALTPRKLCGIGAGVVGVALLVDLHSAASGATLLVAIAAALGGAFCYAFASTYIKKRAAPIPSAVMAAGSQICAALLLLPLLPFAPWHSAPSLRELGLILVLGLFCTAIAYLLFFRLVRDVGPTRALTVTFLVPLFAVLWGWLFIGEALELRMAEGGGLVVLATWLVLGGRA